MSPGVEKSFLNALKMVHDGLFVVWNSMLERFQVFYRDSRSGITRIILTVENDDGSYRPCDMRTIDFLNTYVCWDILDKFPNPKDLGNYLISKSTDRKLKKEEYRREYQKWWNRENRTRWKKVLENAQRGIFHVPNEDEKKIYIHS